MITMSSRQPWPVVHSESWNMAVPKPQNIEKKENQHTSSQAHIPVFGIYGIWHMGHKPFSGSFALEGP